MDIHSSLGHLSQDNLKHLKLRTNVKLDYACDVCSATKTARSVPKRKIQKPHHHLYEFLYSDICKMPVCSVDGFKYVALLFDDASRYSHFVLLHKKSDKYRGLYLIDEGSIAISTIRTDQGSEYLSKTFQSLCMSSDIRQ